MDQPDTGLMTLEAKSCDQEEVAQPKRQKRQSEPPMRTARLPPKPPGSRLASLSMEREPRQPTIERGGTNTVVMEVSGIGSTSTGGGGGGEGDDMASVLSQATKESVVRKRRKRLDFQPPSETGTSAKPPLPPNPVDTPTNSTPQPHNQLKKVRRKSVMAEDESGYVTLGDDTPKRKQPSTRLATEAAPPAHSAATSTNGSPVLDELHPFSAPERAFREALRDVDSSDWSSKCDGLLAVRRLAMFHPEVLGPQLHTVILSVQKEVGRDFSLQSTDSHLSSLVSAGEEPSLPGGQGSHCLPRGPLCSHGEGYGLSEFTNELSTGLQSLLIISLPRKRRVWSAYCCIRVESRTLSSVRTSRRL